METYVAVAALAALAQDVRLAIFRLLVQAGPDGLAVGHVGKALAIPAATLSFHLTQLKHAGLVTVRRKGREHIHAAAFDRMNDLVEYLTQNCCSGDPAACLPTVAACAPAKPRRKK